MLQNMASEFGQTLFYVCGPPAMCRVIAGDLCELGMPRGNLRLEQYD